MARIGWSDFVIWQCSLRQRNFRMFGGKPSEGTMSNLSDIKTNKNLAVVRSILLEKNSFNTSKMFEFMHKQTHDPEIRFDKAIKFFSSEYYNTPKNFDGSFSATFNYQSSITKNLLKKKKVSAQFFERETGFNFMVNVSKLKKSDAKWQYTFWHNRFFNPALSENIEILNFSPVKTGVKKIN
tara:strand:- start:77 stop:622 length:546 start_codon:yes stop_codon:yes gene_type:complete